MTGGAALSEDLRGVLVYMRHTSCLDVKTISQLTGIPRRTVYHVLSIYKHTGIVKPAPEGQRGRPRAIDFGGVQVSF